MRYHIQDCPHEKMLQGPAYTSMADYMHVMIVAQRHTMLVMLC